MCDPMTIMAVASTGMSIAGQSAAAKAQAQAQKQQMEAEVQRLSLENTARRAGEAQELEARAKKTQELIEATRSAKSTANLAAIEGGVGGNSVNALIDDYERQSAAELYALTQQEGWSGVNSMLQDENASFASQQRMVSINQPIQQPNYLGEAVNLGGQVMGIRKDNQMFELQKEQLRLQKAKV